MGEFLYNSPPYVPTHQICFIADMNFTLVCALLPRALALLSLCSHGPTHHRALASHPWLFSDTSVYSPPVCSCFPGALFLGSGTHLPPVATFGHFGILILNWPFGHGFSRNLQLSSDFWIPPLAPTSALKEIVWSSPGLRCPILRQWGEQQEGMRSCFW